MLCSCCAAVRSALPGALKLSAAATYGRQRGSRRLRAGSTAAEALPLYSSCGRAARAASRSSGSRRAAACALPGLGRHRSCRAPHLAEGCRPGQAAQPGRGEDGREEGAERGVRRTGQSVREGVARAYRQRGAQVEGRLRQRGGQRRLLRRRRARPAARQQQRQVRQPKVAARQVGLQRLRPPGAFASRLGRPPPRARGAEGAALEPGAGSKGGRAC